MYRQWPRASALLLPLLLTPLGSAQALSFGIEILEAGASMGGVDQAAMTCAGAAPIYHCAGGGAAVGNLLLDGWSFDLDEDPVVSGTTHVVNSSALAKHFTLIFTLALPAPFGPSTLIGGSVQGGTTDLTGDGSSLTTLAGSPFYAAQIDGATVQTLFSAPQAISAGAFQSANLPQASFGTPIASLPAGPALSTIGIILDFVLSPGDAASFTSVFVVEVPEPGTGLLVASGAVAFALALRRRRALQP